MDISILFLSFYIGVMVYIANLNEIGQRSTKPEDQHSDQQRQTLVRWMLLGLVGMKFVYSLLTLQFAFLSANPEIMQQFETQLSPIDPASALLNFIFTVVLTYISFRIIQSQEARQFIRRLISSGSSYNPASGVHTAAIVLLLCFVSFTFDQLVASGGLTGLAEDVAQNGLSIGLVIFQAALMVIIAFLGIGLAIRRDLPHSLERLGLKIPTVSDVIWGILGGLILYGVSLIGLQLWSLFVPIEVINQQSAAGDQVVKLFNTLPLAFLLSLLAAVSEEILFRGALQPVSGLPVASLFFALSHIQYALTPATLIVFVVGMGLGWLRRRRNTSSAIIAHFVYDFVQLALAVLVLQAGGGV